jgi:spermidine synthase
MSNHEFETLTNQKFLDNAKGDILIFGLGIGLIIFPLLTDNDIKSITIVEIDDGLIDEVFPIIIKNDLESKVSVILSNAFDFETDKMFDTIYFDIWSVIDQQSFLEMKILSEKFTKNLKPGGWMDSWCSEEENYI